MDNTMIVKAMETLDRIIQPSLQFSKSAKNAQNIMEDAGMMRNKIGYLLNKLKYHNREFAGFFCNLDEQNARLVLRSLGLNPEKGKMPEDDAAKWHMRFDFQQGIKNRWDYEPFEILLVRQFCLMAFNTNPIHFFETELKDDAMVVLFKKSKIKNYGNFRNWANFWHFLNEKNYQSGRQRIVEFLENFH